jgi:hypothetical protein
MIVGIIKRSALSILEQLPYTFYLGGSRRMAERWQEWHNKCDPMVQGDCPQFAIWVTEETDYDFYATFSPQLSAHLIDNGFELSEANQYYLDSECEVIYKKDNVQVVLRTDAEFYRTVFENIDLEVYYNYLWKSSPTKPNRQLIGPFFNMLFDIAHAAKGEK